MITVASKELKNRLGRYLSVVRNGDAVQVTARGKLVACLVPAGSVTQPDARILTEVSKKGAVRLGTSGMIPHRRGVILRPGKSLSEMVAEQRR